MSEIPGVHESTQENGTKSYGDYASTKTELSPEQQSEIESRIARHEAELAREQRIKDARRKKVEQDYAKFSRELEQRYNQCLNTRGKVYCDGGIADTRTVKEKMEEVQREAARKTEEYKKNAVEWVNKNVPDVLGSRQMVVDAIMTVKPPNGSAKIEVGYSISTGGKVKIPGSPDFVNEWVNKYLDEKGDMNKSIIKSEGKLGEECDNDKDLAVGISGDKEINTGFTGFKGVKIEFRAKVSGGINAACIDKKSTAKAAATAVPIVVDDKLGENPKALYHKTQNWEKANDQKIE